jgi:hypothetical protein
VGNAIGNILPLALGVAISPIPIIAVILMLLSPKAHTNGPAFLVGWVAGLAAVSVAVTALSGTAGLGSGGGSSVVGSLIKILLGLLLVGLAVREFRNRPRNLAVMSGTHSGTWPGRKPRTVSEQRSHRSRRTLRLRCDKRLEFPWDPWPFRGTRSAVQGSPNRVYQTPVVKATREPYPCLVVVNAVHKLRGGAERVDAGKGSA